MVSGWGQGPLSGLGNGLVQGTLDRRPEGWPPGLWGEQRLGRPCAGSSLQQVPRQGPPPWECHRVPSGFVGRTLGRFFCIE